MVPNQEPVMTTRADLVVALEELQDVLVRIDDKLVDRRYVDFGALAKREGVTKPVTGANGGIEFAVP